MRTLPRRLLVATALLIGAGPGSAGAAAREELKLEGTWKLVILTRFIDNELLVLDVKPVGDGFDAAVVDAPPFPRAPRVTEVGRKGQQVTLTIDLNGSEARFRGMADADGPVLGALSVQGQTLPARLEKTDARRVSRQVDPTMIQGYVATRKAPDPVSRAKALQGLIESVKGNPKADIARNDLLQIADRANLSAEQVGRIVEDWVAAAKPYGEDYLAQVRMQALKALAGKKPYTKLVLDLAVAADKEVGQDAATQSRAELARLLAEVAKEAGKADLAAEAETRAKQLAYQAAVEADKAIGPAATAERRADAAARLAIAAKEAGEEKVAAEAEARGRQLNEQLDEEYRKKVPPFQPKSVARKGGDSSRVVLMELFTGAQCPPCVAADVAFDALNQSYRPTELITLQYHLHIPGPDPLTNRASEARQDYYGEEVGGTPATFFNGKAQAGGGGVMDASEGKYDEYREIIDRALAGAKKATIDLKADRSGDAIQIRASAKVDSGDGASKPKLRLVLVEEQVRYVGGNRLRFHHHVVRAMPGGPQGEALADGKGQVEQTVKLAEVRKNLEQYLGDFVKNGGSFPNPLPPVELDDLMVVAFVQDDESKEVLHAVAVPVKGEKEGGRDEEK